MDPQQATVNDDCSPPVDAVVESQDFGQKGYTSNHHECQNEGCNLHVSCTNP
jgi:hypothetical protein